jgi:Transcriptional Coactivator p15 (PC4)
VSHPPGAQRTTLREPVDVDKWWKNRRGDVIRVRLSTFEDRNLVDLRTWFTAADGTLAPGKGFSSSIKHLPRLAEAFAKAAAKARELGLIGDDEEARSVAARAQDPSEPTGKFSDLPLPEERAT